VIGPVEAILVVPALAIPVLALISDYRLGVLGTHPVAPR
jgi:hypothetical protein